MVSYRNGFEYLFGERKDIWTDHLADRTLYRPLSIIHAASPTATNASRTTRYHIQDRRPLETMWAFLAGHGVGKGEKGERTFDANSLARNGQVIVIDCICILPVCMSAGACSGGGGCLGGEPGVCMREWRGIVTGVQSVVNDAFEADVVVVCCIAI